MLQGMIYVVRLKCGLVKIGFAKRPLARLSQLSMEYGENLEAIGVMAGERAEETAVQKLFAPYWVRGEWFAITDEHVASIGLDPFPPHEPRYNVDCTSHVVFPADVVQAAKEGKRAVEFKWRRHEWKLRGIQLHPRRSS